SASESRISPTSALSFFLSSFGDHRVLHSFPTRRSSDLHGRGAFPHHDVVPRGRHDPRRPFRPCRTRATAGVLHRPEGADRLPHEIGRAQRLNSSHVKISYAVFCLKKKKTAMMPARHTIS